MYGTNGSLPLFITDWAAQPPRFLGNVHTMAKRRKSYGYTSGTIMICSVVQSSGTTGKSRTVDELGKKHFSIPINLRDAQSTGQSFLASSLFLR